MQLSSCILLQAGDILAESAVHHCKMMRHLVSGVSIPNIDQQGHGTPCTLVRDWHFYLPRQKDAVRLDVPVDDVAVVAVLQGL